jgi:hypothetical protein
MSFRGEMMNLPDCGQEHSRAHVVCHCVKTEFFLDLHHSDIIRDDPLVGIYKDHLLIIRQSGYNFRKQLVEQYRVKRPTQFVKTVFVRLKFTQPELLPQEVYDMESHPVVMAIDIPVSND